MSDDLDADAAPVQPAPPDTQHLPAQPPVGYGTPQYGYAAKEPSALKGVVLAVISLVIMIFSGLLSLKIPMMDGWQAGVEVTYYSLLTAAQLTLAICGLVVCRAAMKCRPCRRASVGFTLSLVDTAFGALIVLQFAVDWISRLEEVIFL